VHPDARPSPGNRVLPRVRVDVRQRPVRVVARQVPVPELFQEGDRGRPADLLAAHLTGQLPGLGVGVAEHERRGREDQQLVAAAAVPGQAALHVGVERLAVFQRAVPAEDRVGAGGGELAALVGVAGLEDDRPALGAARHVEPPADVELGIGVREPAGDRVGEEHAGFLVGDDLVAVPGVEQFPCGAQERLRPLVPRALRQVAAAPEVLAGERVPRRHHVPRGAAAGRVIQGGELPGHLVRLVERGVDRARQAKPGGHGGERGQDRERVGTADDVQVVNLAALLTEPQPLGKEQEVELGPLGGASQVRERAELDMAARARVAPHRGVIHAGKVRREMDLLQRPGHSRFPPVPAAA
jgi:hypothetical protein